MESLKLEVDQLERALLSLDSETAKQIILHSVEKRAAVDVVGNLISKALERIGDAWESGSVSLSQVYISGLICEEIVGQVFPPETSLQKTKQKIAIGVYEDYHLLGKRILYASLRSSGYDLMDLGGGLTAEEIVQKVQDEHIQVLLLSVLMLPSALKIKRLRALLKDAEVKILVGGAPFRFDPELWKEVDVDGCGNDVTDAIAFIQKYSEEVP